jgi:hypothetical protein
MQKIKHGFLKGLRMGSKALNDHFVPVLVIAALVIISTMLIVQFATYQPERYTGFGVTNSNKEAGPFPANVTHNGTLMMYTYVQNHEGNVGIYKLEVFIGDASTIVDPVHGIVGGTIVSQFHEIVLDGHDWEQQVTIQFSDTFVGFKTIFFALWIYDTGTSTFIFMKQELHVRIDVLGP